MYDLSNLYDHKVKTWPWVIVPGDGVDKNLFAWEAQCPLWSFYKKRRKWQERIFPLKGSFKRIILGKSHIFDSTDSTDSGWWGHERSELIFLGFLILSAGTSTRVATLDLDSWRWRLRLTAPRSQVEVPWRCESRSLRCESRFPAPWVEVLWALQGQACWDKS